MEIPLESLPRDARKRPTEQLFDITRDPACIEDLARDAAFKQVRDDLRDRLTETLTRQGDPRFHGYGDIWESYPRFGPMRPELGGLTISEDGCLEELEEFFESLATLSASSVLTLISSATCFSNVAIR